MSDKTKKETPSLEENFLEIEQILEQMDNPEVSLDDSFLLYQQGVKRLKSSNILLDEVEKKMQILNADGEPEDM